MIAFVSTNITIDFYLMRDANLTLIFLNIGTNIFKNYQ